MSIAVIDYGMGNLRSVSKALEHVAGGVPVIVTADPAQVARLDAESKLAVATDLGKTTHRSIVQAFARSGALQKCMPPGAKSLKPTLTFYVVVAADGTEQRALFLPEGSITECLQRSWTERKYLPPGVASTFRWTVKVD